mmetsp:Transcript_9958/g.16395  ORF Transcript_9958/g.16395 Transcript_9958/m.16395 type:complete len:457 (+) Transcript_9958:115-1485(+)
MKFTVISVVSTIVATYLLVGTHSFQFRIKSPVFRTYSSLRASDDWSEDDLNFKTKDIQPPAPKVTAALNKAFGVIVTSQAIHTVSYYMREFGDTINMKWMTEFKDFIHDGFDDDDWHGYLEDMINLDKQEVKVYIAPRSVSRSPDRQVSEKESNLRGMYLEEIEPRKLAHKIVAVRENICEEVIQDLGSIRLENEEAIRYATTWVNSDYANAEKTRHLTRVASQGGSTPLRHKTFDEVGLLVTNMALDVVKEDLSARKETGSIKLIDEILAKVTKEIEMLDPVDKKIAESRLSQTFLEKLCHLGLSEGAFNKESDQPCNVLKLAQNLLDTRLSIAMASITVLESQNRENRSYYKLIKDKGGFQKFNLRPRKPEIKIVNIEEEQRKDAEEKAAARAQKQKLAAEKRALAEKLRMEKKQQEKLKREQAEAKKKEMIVSQEADDGMGLFGAGTIGPVMM